MLHLPLTTLTNDILITAGILLIALELNRPGTILPGCLGVASISIAVASILRGPHPIVPLVWLAALPALTFASTRSSSRLLVGGITVAVSDVLRLNQQEDILDFLAVFACGSILFLALDRLTRSARQARANKFPSNPSNPTSSAPNPVN